MISKNTSRRIALLKKSLVLVVVVAAIFAFSSKEMVARDPVTKKISNNATPSDTTKPSWTGRSVGSTKEGVSQNLMNAYQQIIDRNKKPVNGWFNNFKKDISKTDRNRMEEIYIRMNRKQKNEQTIIFFKPAPPLPRVVPTEKQFENFKNPKIYGVWINEKKISNNALNNYAANDFAQLFVSKLYGPAKNGRIYSYQVNLMTKDYYQDYYNKTMSDTSRIMLYQFAKPKVTTTIEPVKNSVH